MVKEKIKDNIIGLVFPPIVYCGVALFGLLYWRWAIGITIVHVAVFVLILAMMARKEREAGA